MSGGYYNYAHGRVRDLADSIRGDVDAIDDDRIRNAMSFIADLLVIAADAAHNAEWLMSDDIGGEAMLVGVNNVKAKLKELVGIHEPRE